MEGNSDPSRKRYLDINDLHLKEILEREHQIVVGRESLRLRLRGAGIGPKRKRRVRKSRCRRERKPAAGMMLQIDASAHDWLEGRGPPLTLRQALPSASHPRLVVSASHASNPALAVV